MNNYYQIKDLWSQHVQDFKDSEDKEGITKYDAEQLVMSTLRFVRYTRIRQYNLFSQQRGEEFEKMVEWLRGSYDKNSIQRFLDNDELWKITLELGME